MRERLHRGQVRYKPKEANADAQAYQPSPVESTDASDASGSAPVNACAALSDGSGSFSTDFPSSLCGSSKEFKNGFNHLMSPYLAGHTPGFVCFKPCTHRIRAKTPEFLTRGRPESDITLTKLPLCEPNPVSCPRWLYHRLC